MTKAILLVLIVMIFCALALASGCGSLDKQRNAAPPAATAPSSNARNSTPPPKAPTPPTQTTMVQNLAVIEGVQGNEAKISRIRTLLAQLDSKYPENDQQIGDMTAAAYNEIQKKGHSASIIGIMEAMIKVSESKTKITYADAVTSYALLRVSGMK
jgi:hypothetical protein